MIETFLLESSTLPDPIDVPKELGKLSSERIEKIKRFKQPESRKQCFGAGLLLEYGLRRTAVNHLPDKRGQQKTLTDELLSVQNIEEENSSLTEKICFHSYGKPYLAGIPFNLSHTTGYVILSILTQHEKSDKTDISIGCDIEPVKAYHPQIARRFFTRNEYLKLEQADSRIQAELFCQYWTRKESVLKMTGLGIAMPMDLFDISSGSKAAADREKTLAWQETVQKKEQTSRKPAKEDYTEKLYHHAAKSLLDDNLYMKEHRYDECCITVCSNYMQFAQELRVVHL